jgi:DNA-binding MarR family transcriptional regulator
MAELADRLGLSPSATTRLVDRLEERTWVRRESPRENRRTVNVIITADGRRAYVRNNRLFTATVEEAVAAHLSEDEMSTLISLLRRLSDAATRS